MAPAFLRGPTATSHRSVLASRCKTIFAQAIVCLALRWALRVQILRSASTPVVPQNALAKFPEANAAKRVLLTFAEIHVACAMAHRRHHRHLRHPCLGNAVERCRPLRELDRSSQDVDTSFASAYWEACITGGNWGNSRRVGVAMCELMNVDVEYAGCSRSCGQPPVSAKHAVRNVCLLLMCVSGEGWPGLGEG